MKKTITMIAFLLTFCFSYAMESMFISQGKTEYVIVIPDQPDTGNQFALKELTFFLKKASGADFKSVPAAQTPNSKRIFLGLSDAALKALGKDPRPAMKNQETWVKTKGDDLFLFGKGPWGDMFAVYDYLENVLGYRWYDARGGMKVPDCRNLKWQPLNREINFSVAYRSATGYWIYHRPQAHLAFLRNRQNFNYISMYLKMKGIVIPPPEENGSSSHTLPSYIPGETNRNVYKPYSWLKNKNYWKTNPEFFGVRENGKRSGVTHLCFSNAELRKELTANILEHMKREPGKNIFSVSAHDSPDRFCCCPACMEQEKKYKTPGAAYFNYLIELGKTVAEKYPKNRISFLVYRKKQTQIPPSGIDKLPANLLPVFAPIDDDFSKSWAHKKNEKTHQDLKRWGEISSGIAVWYYPNPYSGDITPPLGNIRRLVFDIREMVKAGMTYSYFEHNVGVANMIGFTELQSFLILQLFKDASQDENALIREFMDFEYGKAAPLMLKYLDELETATAENRLFMSWNAPLPTYEHLTAENLVRWHGYFTEMEKLLADSPVQLQNLKRVKINLEFAMLLRYNRIIRKIPDFKIKPQALAESVQKEFRKTITDFFDKGFEFRAKNALRWLDGRIHMALVQAGREGKPLPAEIFGKIPAERIIQFVPKTNGKIRALETDPDAAWGVAAVQVNKPVPRLPYPIHIYDYVARRYYPALLRINKDSISPRGKYKIFRVTRSHTLSPNCELQLGEDSWFQIRANLGEAYEDGSLNQVEIYASLKFEGPAFYPEDKGKTDRVFCDRVIVVKLPHNQ